MTPPAPADPRNDGIMKVLIIRLSALGDVVRTLPALTCLRRAWPEARIDWAVEEAALEVVRDQPALDGVVVFPRRSLARAARRFDAIPAAWRALRDVHAALRDARYDVVIDFQGTLKTGILSRLTGAPRRIGFGPGHAREGSHRFYTEAVPLPSRRMNRVERALAMIAHIGIDTTQPGSDIPEAPADAAYASDFLAGLAQQGGRGGAPAVIFPGTSAAQAYKRYPASHFAAAADRIAGETGAPIVVAWGPGEEALAEEVAGAMTSPAVVAPPMTIGQLSSLIRRSRVFISSDTGPMHIAWTVGAPVVAVLGPTDPVLNRPAGRWGAVAYRKIVCSPCRNRGCIARTCLHALPPGEVAGAAIDVMRRAEAEGRRPAGAATGDPPRMTMGPGEAPGAGR